MTYSFKYQYDRNANSETNLIQEESHEITTNGMLPILFGEGLAYTNTGNFSITNASTSAPLVLGTDYTLVGEDAYITSETGYMNACGIILTNTAFTGTLNFTYQTVGGPEGKYSSILEDLITAIELAKSDTSISWQAIVNKPALFPPEPHTHPLSELTQQNTLTEALWSLAESLVSQTPMKYTRQNFYELLDGVISVQASMQNSLNLAQMVDNTNPNITYLVNKIDGLYQYSDGTTTVTANAWTDILSATATDKQSAQAMLLYKGTATHGTITVNIDWSDTDTPTVTLIGTSGTFTDEPDFDAVLSGDDIKLQIQATEDVTIIGKWISLL